MDYGFPELTDSFLAGQDIFYVQFNDIAFYIEDTDQEHLYFNILKRVFPNIRFDKIFPLHGKGNLKDHAKDNLGDKSKVYIADLDFDEILGVKEDISNVFYLNRYSVENYLVDEQGLYELIREKSPKMKDNDIAQVFDFNACCDCCKVLLSDLACSFVVIQKYSLGKEYFGVNPPRDFCLDDLIVKNSFLPAYYGEIERALKEVDGRFTLKSKLNEFKEYFNSVEKSLSNIPGKYLLNLLKYQLEKLGLLNQFSIETLTYKLSKESDIRSFDHLKTDVTNYIS